MGIWLCIWFCYFVSKCTGVFRRVLQWGGEDLRAASRWENQAALRRRSHAPSRVFSFSWPARIRPASNWGHFGKDLQGYFGKSGKLSCIFTLNNSLWWYLHFSLCIIVQSIRTRYVITCCDCAESSLIIRPASVHQWNVSTQVFSVILIFHALVFCCCRC